MLRKFLPFAILLVALGAVALWIWPRAGGWHHGRQIIRLAILHRERQGPAWPAADAERLWTSIHWFRLNDPEGLRRRIVEGIRDEDPDHREAAAVLAGELLNYSSYPQLSTHYAPSEFPYPNGCSRGDELTCFRIRDLVAAHPDVFAGLARDESARTRTLFLYLGDAKRSEAMRHAVETIAVKDSDDDLRIEALDLLAREGSTPSTIRVLRRLQADPKPRLRWAAASALARVSDPEGTRRFIEALSLPHPVLDKHDLMLRVAFLRGSFSSLQEAASPLLEYLGEDWRPGDGLPCDLRAPWEAWLELRESEGFTPEPQKARDAAYEEWERLGYP